MKPGGLVLCAFVASCLTPACDREGAPGADPGAIDAAGEPSADAALARDQPDPCDGRGADGEPDELCPCGLLGVPCPTGFTCQPGHQDGWSYCESEDGGSVYVPAGEFWMGCNTDNGYEAGWCATDEKDAEGGSHLVHVPAFVVQRTEVSIESYSRCPEAQGCAPSPCDHGAGTPAACLNWQQAGAYCAWLPPVAGQGWRLCTEAEWEKAARGGCDTVEAESGLGCRAGMRLYPWSAPGDTAAATCAHAWLDDPSAGGAACGAGSVSTEVDSMPQGASPYGALDMAGNVWEWVEDCYHLDYTGAPGTGLPWTSGCAFTSSARVRRGGGRDNPGPGVRAAYRFGIGSAFGFDHLGLRCCRSTDG